jgi:Xaa-Pro aminopeptidase
VNERLRALRELLRERDLEALLVLSPSNRRYLSGFSGSAGTLLVTPDAALIFTDFRYRDQAAREAPDFALRQIGVEKPLEAALAEAIEELRLHLVAFEAGSISVAVHGKLLAATADLPAALIPRDGLVEQLRVSKDAADLAPLRRAIAITDAALAAVLPALRPEMSEKQAAWLLEVAMRERGADALAFPIIFGAGPNGASPHARASDELLGSGRPIVIDCGALLNGYHADLTRTVVLGQPDERFMQIYELVHAAQRRAIAGIRAGMSCKEVDALARDYLAEAGYGEQFGHGLGHGVGLEIHEDPRLSRVNERPLPAGAVTSVEPGIYLPGWGGVRIEDLVLVGADGCEVLSQSPYDPVISG